MNITKLIKLNQLILGLSCAFTGIIFAGRSDIQTWLLISAAIISGKIVQSSFRELFDKGNKNQRHIERLNQKSEIKPVFLWIYAVLFSLILLGAAFLINPVCYTIAIASVILMIIIPLLRRFTSVPYYFLHIFEAVSVAGGFIAANGRYEYPASILATSVLLWAAAAEFSLDVFDMKMYNGQKSSLILTKIGEPKIFLIIIFLFLLSVSGFIVSGYIDKRKLAFWLGLICAGIILIRQITLLKDKDTETAKKEFLQINNFYAPAIFLGALIDVFFN